MLQYLLTIFMLFTPPTPEASDPVDGKIDYVPVGITLPTPEATPHRSSVWVKFGHGRASNYYNDDGDRVELGQITLPPELGGDVVSTNAEIQVFTVHIGGALNVLQMESAGVSVGAELGLVQRTLTADAVEVPGVGPIVSETDISSGFAPQNIRVFVEGGTSAVGARAGFILDVGQEEEDDQFANSDGQNALLFGVSGQHQLPSVRLYGSLDYFLMLDGSGHGIADDYNHGDLFSAQAGLGYDVGPVEIGATLIYRRTSEGQVQGIDGGNFGDAGAPNPFDVTSVLSVAPYVEYASENEPFSIYVKGAEQREYVDYGFAIAGQNDLSPRVGFTVGATYGF